MGKQAIYAVHDRDLEVFLKSIGILEKITNGEIKCTECDRVITLENIGFILPSQEEIKICCDSPPCYYKMIGKRRRGY